MRNVYVVVIVHCEGIPVRNHGCNTIAPVKVHLTPKSDRDGYTKNHLYVRESDVDEALEAVGWTQRNVHENLVCPACAALP